MHDASPLDARRLVVYGFGRLGRRVVDRLIDLGVRIAAIADAKAEAGEHRGVPVLHASALADGDWTGAECLVALSNQFASLVEVDAFLRKCGFQNVFGLPGAARRFDLSGEPGAYWLDFGFMYEDHQPELQALDGLLADPLSRSLLAQIVSYRSTGDLSACPVASLHDEYTPADLPRFREPVRLIDCGAYDGAAIRRFVQAGYRLEHVLAFEPDPANFAALRAQIGEHTRATLLPMAAWSSLRTLRFSAGDAMASGVTDGGELLVQACAVDDLAVNWSPTLVKMDIEGSEMEALRGMEQTIRAHRPDLCLSLYHTPRHLFEIPLLVASWGLGYRLHLRVHEENTFGVVLYALQDRDAVVR